MRCCCLETLRGQPSEARQWGRAKGAARLTSLRPLRLRGAAGEQLELGLRTHPRVLQECPLSTVISRRVWHSGISASTRQSCEIRLFFFVHTLACNSAVIGGPLRTKHPRVRGSAAQHEFAASSLIASLCARCKRRNKFLTGCTFSTPPHGGERTRRKIACNFPPPSLSSAAK